MAWIYIIIGFILFPIVLYGALKLWFRTLAQKEIKRGKALVEELRQKGTPRLSKEEQFEFLDGNWDFTKIKDALQTNEIDLLLLDYFIDVEPDEYLEHLRKNNPPSTWKENTYGEVQIEKGVNKCKLHFYNHGKKMKTIAFDSYDTLLKYLVFDRLTNLSHKYKKKFSKKYYA